MSHKKDTKEAEEKAEAVPVPAPDFESMHKRALADYQNLQKQTAKEKEEFARYVKANLIMEFIPIYENLQAAVEHAEEGNSWLTGITYVIKQFEDMLVNNGVEIMNPFDEVFNPTEHEAVDKVATDDDAKVNKVAKVVKVGYKLGGKVIQPAKVAVYGEKNQNS